MFLPRALCVNFVRFYYYLYWQKRYWTGYSLVSDFWYPDQTGRTVFCPHVKTGPLATHSVECKDWSDAEWSLRLADRSFCISSSLRHQRSCILGILNILQGILFPTKHQLVYATCTSIPKKLWMSKCQTSILNLLKQLALYWVCWTWESMQIYFEHQTIQKLSGSPFGSVYVHRWKNRTCMQFVLRIQASEAKF